MSSFWFNLPALFRQPAESPSGDLADFNLDGAPDLVSDFSTSGLLDSFSDFPNVEKSADCSSTLSTGLYELTGALSPNCDGVYSLSEHFPISDHSIGAQFEPVSDQQMANGDEIRAWVDGDSTPPTHMQESLSQVNNLSSYFVISPLGSSSKPKDSWQRMSDGLVHNPLADFTNLSPESISPPHTLSPRDVPFTSGAGTIDPRVLSYGSEASYYQTDSVSSESDGIRGPDEFVSNDGA